MGAMDWSEYVRRVVGDDRQTEVARKTGIDQTTVSRWLNPHGKGSQRISSQSVAKFARGYGRNVLEAFVIAGFLTAKEAGMKPGAPTDLGPDLRNTPSEAMFAELQRRLSG